MIITAVGSALADNASTMLLMIPVTIETAVTLKINPIALLVSEAFASNIGGTATLIGDPPNILIGSYANLSFGDFVVNLTLICLVVLLVTASAFIDNIPFTATMLPIVCFLNHTIPGPESRVLWWSLALRACLGGNGSMIGASANVVTVGMAEKAGYQISFIEYMKACFLPMLLSVALVTAHLLRAY